MAQPYVGELRMFAGNFAPAGWMFCEGQLLPISENETLFNLIGTTYGGDGQSTFALPDLRGRIPIHFGNGFTLAETGGAESVTLTTQQIPAHSHVPQGDSNSGNSDDPSGRVWASSSAIQFIAGVNANTDMNTSIVGSTGGSQPHDNMPPYLVVSFIISLFGIFPSQT
ncbi:MAG: phage tail protein [Ignavibacteriae bacterium]|nr:phage tail protein [Ignavibacteria bacterium]MBI3365801.1 phage tail protein [Ignavibacteriota bacterium]